MSIAAKTWVKTVLQSQSSNDTWNEIFKKLQELAMTASSPDKLHQETVISDRLIAESGWNLWADYSKTAPKTAMALSAWWQNISTEGKAVLILDGLSIRELLPLLEGAKNHDVKITNIRVTGAEVPSDTDFFASALGVSSRSKLSNNHAPSGFIFSGESTYTDVINVPFEDCTDSYARFENLFLWHTWPDVLIHSPNIHPDQVHKTTSAELKSDGFWNFVNRMRQGRRMIITSDHGYAVSRLFSSEEQDPEAKELLKEFFSASRYSKAKTTWPGQFMPPLVLTENGYHVVMGQRKWRVPSGFPQICHGGLSLLEVSVPFIELPAIQR